ncbi:OmpA family protein [bacterium]
MKIKQIRNLFHVIMMNLLLFVFVSQATSYSSLRKAMFAETDQIMVEAKDANAEILAPSAYGNALQNYRKAEVEFDKGNNLSEVRRLLNSSILGLDKSIKNARLAVLVFGMALQARTDAISAESHLLQIPTWQQAEKKFAEAAVMLENGNLNGAKKKGDEAEKLYRDTELQAIKINYLNEAYDLIKEAESNKAKDFAPMTLKKAKDLVNQAEHLLKTDRYDTDQPRIFARQARREARHAVYLTRLLQKIKESKFTQEEILLASEAPLKKVASRMELNLTYEEGFNKSTQEVLKGIDDQKQLAMTQKNDLFDCRKRGSMLAVRTKELEDRLGIVETEKTAMASLLEAQAKLREKYNAVQALFTRDEAVILREGNDLRIRLTGISFPVGEAYIEPQYFPFLRKVIQAIQMFPGAEVMIEGHTDSFGGDAFNLELSQDRAFNVTDYMLNSGQFQKDKFNAIGYGESRPIATNETDEGRARNRRIAVVIHPNMQEVE